MARIYDKQEAIKVLILRKQKRDMAVPLLHAMGRLKAG